jgi:hypothetical protein
MNWIFIVIGFITAFLGLGGLIVAIIHDIPHAKRISKTNEVAKAQKINGKLDLWNGPIPYGLILLGPLIFFIISIVVSLIIYIIYPNYIKLFSTGVIFVIIWNIIALYDPKGRFKRDFNLKFGDNWKSKLLENGTLQDEQKLKDIPLKVKQARNFLLSNDGNHSDTKEVQAAFSTLIKYDKPIPEKQEKETFGTKHIIRSSFEFKKLLLYYSKSIWQDDDKDITDVSYHFYTWIKPLQ